MRVCTVETVVAVEGSRDLGIWAGRKKKNQEKKEPAAEKAEVVDDGAGTVVDATGNVA